MDAVPVKSNQSCVFSFPGILRTSRVRLHQDTHVSEIKQAQSLVPCAVFKHEVSCLQRRSANTEADQVRLLVAGCRDHTNKNKHELYVCSVG